MDNGEVGDRMAVARIVVAEVENIGIDIAITPVPVMEGATAMDLHQVLALVTHTAVCIYLSI